MDSKEDQLARKKLGKILKEAREKAGLTQAEVAAKAKVNANYYAIVERGEGTYSFANLQRIMKVLHIKSLDL
ncbi:MAG TPA: helix-turn-helix transcriptional regulator [Patescibacteria group bacterium]